MARWMVLFSLILSSTVWGAKDPTAPLGWSKPKTTVKKEQANKLPKLQGIICAEQGKCYATLDNRVVKANERIGRYQVTSVGQDYVMLSSQGKQWKLKLFPLRVKD